MSASETSRTYLLLLGGLALLAVPFLAAETAEDWLRIAAAVLAASLAVIWRTASEQVGQYRVGSWTIAAVGAVTAMVAVGLLAAVSGGRSAEELGAVVGAAAAHGALAALGALTLLRLILVFRFRSPFGDPVTEPEGRGPGLDNPARRAARRAPVIGAGLVLLALIAFAAVTREPGVSGTWVRLDMPQFRFTVQERDDGRIEGSGGSVNSTSATTFDVSGRRVGDNVSLVLQGGRGARAGFEGALVEGDWLSGTLYVEGRGATETRFHRE